MINDVTHTKVTVGATSTAVLGEDLRRRRLELVNDSDAVIYVALGEAAQNNYGIRLSAAGGAYAIDGYVGPVTAICAGNKVLLANSFR